MAQKNTSLTDLKPSMQQRLFKPDSIVTASAIFVAAGFAFGGINTMNWAIIPDTIEYTEAKSGRRHEALTFGMLLLIMKVSSEISMAVIGWALHAAHYESMAHVTGDHLGGIATFMALAPLTGSAICAALLLRLDLTHSGHRALNSET